jgi:hypothetical protein
LPGVHHLIIQDAIIAAIIVALALLFLKVEPYIAALIAALI